MTSSPHPIASRRMAALSAVTATLVLAGCATGPHLVTPDPPPVPKAGSAVPSGHVVVLQDDQQVVGNTAAGRMKIEAGPGLRRIFDWDGLRRGAIVQARDASFTNGQEKGLTYDGKPDVWADANGITKLRYEEGSRYFENMDDAMIWMQIRRLYYTYNNDGLVLGWKREGNTLHVELWQFYVAGNKPTSMPDSESNQITRGPLEVVPQKMYPHLVFADGHTERYTTETAAKYSHAQSGGEAAGSECNWFKRLFNKCPAPAPAPAKETPKPATPAPADNAASNNKPAPKPEKPAPIATITGNVVNVRSGPSTKNQVVTQAKKGDKVEILKSENKWSQVQLKGGKKGWVADFLLDKQ